MNTVVRNRDGLREEWDPTAGVYRRFVDGALQLTKPLTPEELARLEQAELGPGRDTNAIQLSVQARAAVTANLAYLAQVDAGTATNADHIAQVPRLTRQVNALIRLVIGSDLLD